MEREPILENTTVKIRKLIADYNSGRIAIPEFQREYVWKSAKAAALLDSLYRRFPIGSLLLWRTSEAVEARSRTSRKASEAEWLIDGQQRTITLSRIQAGDESLEIWFNAREGEFRRGTRAMRKNPVWFPVNQIWDDLEFGRIQQNLSSLPEADYQYYTRTLQRVREVLDYDVPVVRMIDHSHAAAVKAFERINTMGVKLSRADLESANIAARHTSFIRERVQPLVEWLHAGGFDRLSVTHLFRSCAFVAHPDGRRRTPLHDLDTDEVRGAWKETERGLKQTIGLLKSELGLEDMRLLWSGPLLVPAIALLASRGPDEIDRGELAGWLVLAALLHRYSGSTGAALEQDLKACRERDAIRGLLRNLRREGTELGARPRDFDTTVADRGALLSLWVALRQRRALDLLGRGRIAAGDGVRRHHLLPKSGFPADRRHWADALANIAFVLEGGGESAAVQEDPARFLAELGPRVRESQCIPEDPGLWSMESADRFFKARRELIAAAFDEFVDGHLPGRRL